MPDQICLSTAAKNAIKDSANLQLRTDLMIHFKKSSPSILRWVNNDNVKLSTQAVFDIIAKNTNLKSDEITVTKRVKEKIRKKRKRRAVA